MVAMVLLRRTSAASLNPVRLPVDFGLAPQQSTQPVDSLI
jgi:hypothetical protein